MENIYQLIAQRNNDGQGHQGDRRNDFLYKFKTRKSGAFDSRSKSVKKQKKDFVRENIKNVRMLAKKKKVAAEKPRAFVVPGVIKHSHLPSFLHTPVNENKAKNKLFGTSVKTFTPRNHQYETPEGLAIPTIKKESPFYLNEKQIYRSPLGDIGNTKNNDDENKENINPYSIKIEKEVNSRLSNSVKLKLSISPNSILTEQQPRLSRNSNCCAKSTSPSQQVQVFDGCSSKSPTSCVLKTQENSPVPNCSEETPIKKITPKKLTSKEPEVSPELCTPVRVISLRNRQISVSPSPTKSSTRRKKCINF